MTAHPDDLTPHTPHRLPRPRAVPDPEDLPRPQCRSYIDTGHRRSRVRTAALFGLTLLLVAALAWGFQTKITQLDRTVHRLAVIDRRTRPFAPYRPGLVRIENRVPTVTGPAVLLGVPLLIDAPTLNTERRTVPGLITLTWQAIGGHDEPLRGQAQSILAAYPTDRPPGRSVLPLSLTMPATVRDIERDLDREHVAHRWQLTGRLTPLRPDGTAGTGRDFKSEPFAIVAP